MLAHLKIWLKTQIKKSAGQPSAKWGLLSDILNSDHKWQRFHQHNPWKHLLNRFQYCWILLLRPMCDISTTTRCIWAPSSFIRPCPTPGDKRKRCMWYVTITNLLKPRPDDNGQLFNAMGGMTMKDIHQNIDFGLGSPMNTYLCCTDLDKLHNCVIHPY